MVKVVLCSVITIKGGKIKPSKSSIDKTNPTSQSPLPTAYSFSTTKRNQKSPLGVGPMHSANTFCGFDKASGQRDLFLSTRFRFCGIVRCALINCLFGFDLFPIWFIVEMRQKVS